MRENLYRVCRWARGSAPRGSEEEGQEGLSPGIGPPRNSAGSLGRRARPSLRGPASSTASVTPSGPGTTAGAPRKPTFTGSVSYTHLRAHETPEHLVCRL